MQFIKPDVSTDLCRQRDEHGRAAARRCAKGKRSAAQRPRADRDQLMGGYEGQATD